MVWTVMALPPTGIYHPPVGAMTEVLRRRAIIAESWYNFFYLSVFFLMQFLIFFVSAC